MELMIQGLEEVPCVTYCKRMKQTSKENLAAVGFEPTTSGKNNRFIFNKHLLHSMLS